MKHKKGTLKCTCPVASLRLPSNKVSLTLSVSLSAFFHTFIHSQPNNPIVGNPKTQGDNSPSFSLLPVSCPPLVHPRVKKKKVQPTSYRINELNNVSPRPRKFFPFLYLSFVCVRLLALNGLIFTLSMNLRVTSSVKFFQGGRSPGGGCDIVLVLVRT